MPASDERGRRSNRIDCRVHRLIADVAVFSEGAVLLVRYENVSTYDGQRGWFLPDDFLRHLEHPTDGARRIMLEQVGIEVEAPALHHIESFGDGAWHLTFRHRVGLPNRPTLQPSSNVRDAEWFSLDGFPDADDVAHHGWALDVLATMRSSA